jgi:hypothetical protein
MSVSLILVIGLVFISPLAMFVAVIKLVPSRAAKR